MNQPSTRSLFSDCVGTSSAEVAVLLTLFVLPAVGALAVLGQAVVERYRLIQLLVACPLP